MSGNLWITFVLTKALISVTPGPAVMLVLSHGLASRGRTHLVALGIILVNALYFVLVATGLGALLMFSPGALLLLKWIASACLIYSGVRAFTGSARAAVADEGLSSSAWRSCGVGALLQLANPNAFLFFAAVLPRFVDPKELLLPQICLLGLTSIALDCLVLTAYGAFAAQAAGMASSPRFSTLAHRMAGCLLMATGIGMMVVG